MRGQVSGVAFALSFALLRAASHRVASVSWCIAKALSATSNSPWVLQRNPTPSNRPTLIAPASDLQIGHMTFSAMRYLAQRKTGLLTLQRPETPVVKWETVSFVVTRQRQHLLTVPLRRHSF